MTRVRIYLKRQTSEMTLPAARIPLIVMGSIRMRMSQRMLLVMMESHRKVCHPEN